MAKDNVAGYRQEPLATAIHFEILPKICEFFSVF